jgi:hypothetical protein
MDEAYPFVFFETKQESPSIKSSGYTWGNIQNLEISVRNGASDSPSLDQSAALSQEPQGQLCLLAALG